MVETVKYQILRKLDRVEIRHYPKIVIAKVEGYGENGFNILFRFISGENRSIDQLVTGSDLTLEDLYLLLKTGGD